MSLTGAVSAKQEQRKSAKMVGRCIGGVTRAYAASFTAGAIFGARSPAANLSAPRIW
jgi:hypothetical protein